MARLVYNSDEDKLRQKKLLRNRLIFAMLFTLVFFGILIGRMGYLQWVDYQHYKGMADGNRFSIETLPPVRGKIYDRNGILLADNQPIFVLKFDKKQIPQISKLEQDLLALLPNLSSKKFQKFFKRLKRSRSAKPLIFSTSLTEKQAAIFAVNSHKFPGVVLTAQLQRVYPYQSSLAHALGYVGRIDAREAKRIDKERYRGTEIIGKTGLERQYEDMLHGHPGFQEIETNARGRVLRTLTTTPAKSGQDIHLTIDIRLQTYIEKLVKDHKAAVVVTKPQTGEILAFVSNPAYDINLFTDGISQKNYNRLLNDRRKPLLNRVTNGSYPPGSTVKPFVSLASLEEGIITAKKKIFDPGYFVFMDQRYRDWKRKGHGIVDMKAAIAESCDTYYYDLSLKMGINLIHDSLYPFGFGHKTDVDLPSEKKAILPSKEWKRITHGQTWYKGETINAVIGQGYFTATPIQLAKSVSVLANRGKVVQPHLLKNIKLPEQPHIAIKNNKNWEDVIEAMEEVMHGKRGTARSYARNLNFRMAGKTGTAQVFSLNEEEYDEENIKKSLRDHSLFIGFAPIQQPEVAISVVMENAEIKAAPIAVKVTDYYLNQLQKPLGTLHAN